MDQQAKERWLREQSSLTYSQEDGSNDGTFLKLSADSVQTRYVPQYSQQQQQHNMQPMQQPNAVPP